MNLLHRNKDNMNNNFHNDHQNDANNPFKVNNNNQEEKDEHIDTELLNFLDQHKLPSTCLYSVLRQQQIGYKQLFHITSQDIDSLFDKHRIPIGMLLIMND